MHHHSGASQAQGFRRYQHPHCLFKCLYLRSLTITLSLLSVKSSNGLTFRPLTMVVWSVVFPQCHRSETILLPCHGWPLRSIVNTIGHCSGITISYNLSQFVEEGEWRGRQHLVERWQEVEIQYKKAGISVELRPSLVIVVMLS